MSSGKGKGGGPKRNSVMLQPMAGGSLLPDFDDIDSEEEDNKAPPPPQPQAAPPAAIPGGPIPGVQSGSGASSAPKAGDPNHRPLVGGFAAAAYEAARAHHYKAQAAKQKREKKREKEKREK